MPRSGCPAADTVRRLGNATLTEMCRNRDLRLKNDELADFGTLKSLSTLAWNTTAVATIWLDTKSDFYRIAVDPDK